MADGVALRVAAIRGEPAAAVLRQAAQGSVLDGVDVLRGAGHARGDDDPAARLGDGRAYDLVALDEPLEGAVEPEAVRDAGAPVGDEREEVLVVEPMKGRREAGADVEEVAGDGEPELAVELLAEAA